MMTVLIRSTYRNTLSSICIPLMPSWTLDLHTWAIIAFMVTLYTLTFSINSFLEWATFWIADSIGLVSNKSISTVTFSMMPYFRILFTCRHTFLSMLIIGLVFLTINNTPPSNHEIVIHTIALLINLGVHTILRALTTYSLNRIVVLFTLALLWYIYFVNPTIYYTFFEGIIPLVVCWTDTFAK